MAQVLFFPILFTPDMDEHKRLSNLQLALDFENAELRNQLRRISSPGEQYLARERFYNGKRERWLVYQGLKVEPKTSKA